jgi:hypothetical protein
LRVGVCHERNMSLLTELGNSFLFWFLQRCRSYGAKNYQPFTVVIMFELHFGQRAGGVVRRAVH